MLMHTFIKLKFFVFNFLFLTCQKYAFIYTEYVGHFST